MSDGQWTQTVTADFTTFTYAGLVGSGVGVPRPGEVSLAHRGVLFLDKMPEFGQHVLEVMRQPIEDGVVRIARSLGTLTFPARFTLVGARNPRPCGFYGDPSRLWATPQPPFRTSVLAG